MHKLLLVFLVASSLAFAESIDFRPFSADSPGATTPSTSASPSPDSKGQALTLTQSICIAALSAVPDYWGDFDKAFVRFCSDPLMTEISAVCFAGLGLHPEHWRYFNRAFYREFNYGGIWEAFLTYCANPNLTAPQTRCIHGLTQFPDYFEPIGNSIQFYCGDPKMTIETANCIDALGQYPARWIPRFDLAVQRYCFYFPPLP